MSKMNTVERQQFLAMVRKVVGDNPDMLGQIIIAAQQGIEERLEKVNEQRVNAEFALSSIFDLVPKKSLDARPLVAVKAKRVLMESGAFAGTEFANQLKAEIAEGEALAVQKREGEEEAKRRRIRFHREKMRQKRSPVSTIGADDIISGLVAGRNTLLRAWNVTPRDAVAVDSWAIVVGCATTRIEQEQSLVYLGAPHTGRQLFATDWDASEEINRIRQAARDEVAGD